MTSHFFSLQQVSRAFATTPKSPAEKEDHLEEVYQKLTQREHILKRPDSYSRIWREVCMASRLRDYEQAVDVGVR